MNHGANHQMVIWPNNGGPNMGHLKHRLFVTQYNLSINNPFLVGTCRNNPIILCNPLYVFPISTFANVRMSMSMSNNPCPPYIKLHPMFIFHNGLLPQHRRENTTRPLCVGLQQGCRLPLIGWLCIRLLFSSGLGNEILQLAKLGLFSHIQGTHMWI